MSRKKTFLEFLVLQMKAKGKVYACMLKPTGNLDRTWCFMASRAVAFCKLNIYHNIIATFGMIPQ